MTDSALRIIDSAGEVSAYKVTAREALAPTGFPEADPIVSHVLHHIEDPAQREALISALGLLASATGQTSQLAKLTEILAKLPVSPATEGTLNAIGVLLSGGIGVTGPLTDVQLAARGLATQATLAAVLAKLSADPATQTTLAAVLAKLSADPATQTTLAAVLARLNAFVAGTSADPDYAVAPPPSSGTVTIASGQSLSTAQQVDGKLTGLIISAAWDAAPITFMGSTDGATYYPIYDAGVERSLASASVGPDRMILLSLSDWLGIKFVKIRSGTAAAAVNQTAARTLTLLKVA